MYAIFCLMHELSHVRAGENRIGGRSHPIIAHFRYINPQRREIA